jgi:hypothetical protein
MGRHLMEIVTNAPRRSVRRPGYDDRDAIHSNKIENDTAYAPQSMSHMQERAGRVCGILRKAGELV